MRNNIVVVGYPKSGNTWLNRLLAEVLNCPQAGYYGKRGYKELAMEGAHRKSNCRVFKTHSSIDLLADPIVRKSNLVYIVRDPRDVVVSAKYYFKLSFEKTIKRLTEGTLADRVVHGRSWADHTKEWLDQKVTLVRYEDLLKNTIGTINKILPSLSVEDLASSQARVAQAVANQCFTKRKQERHPNPHNKRLLRKGEQGQYLKELTPAQQERVWQACGAVAKQLGYLK